MRSRALTALLALEDLSSVEGENVEYDRALVDVAMNTIPLLRECDRDTVARLILSPLSPLTD